MYHNGICIFDIVDNNLKFNSKYDLSSMYSQHNYLNDVNDLSHGLEIWTH